MGVTGSRACATICRLVIRVSEGGVGGGMCATVWWNRVFKLGRTGAYAHVMVGGGGERGVYITYGKSIGFIT